MANSADLDEAAHYKPSHLDLHCLQRYMYEGMKGLRIKTYAYILKYFSSFSQKIGFDISCKLSPEAILPEIER